MKQIDRERKHHDDWGKNETRDISKDFEHFLSLENQWVMKHLPDLKNKSVLDIGCGLGEASLYFAKQGADVIAVDLSDGMVEHCIFTAKEKGFDIKGVISPVEKLQLEKNSFDIIYVANILHHLQEPATLLTKASFALKPDGIAFFIDPLKYNPVIILYRRMATSVRTEDENPVGFELIKRMNKEFENVEFSCTWFLSLCIFLKYFFIDKVHPNQDRYWKRIFSEGKQTYRWINPLIKLDRLICRTIPFANYFCWNIVIAARSPKK